jgi:predicted dehydrogenase
MRDPIRVGVIGCGNIAGPYAQDIPTYPNMALAGVTDLDADRAAAFAQTHSTQVYPTLAALLTDPGVDLVVNLTTHHAHKAVTTQALEAGKHVYSEKPLALTYEDARELVELAAALKLRLACSPFTLIGQAQQTAWKLIREGRIGTPRVIYAEVNWGRIESWHPAPEAFYDVGPLFDVGVYPLMILTAMFGPARRVTAFGTVVYPDRVTKEGQPFHLTTPDFVTAVYEMESGAIVRLTCDFYVSNSTTRQTGIEFHGDLGTIALESWANFDSTVLHADFGQPLAPVDLVQAGEAGIPWGRGVHELASAIQEDRPHRFTGEQAAHVVEILGATAEAARSGQPQTMTSGFAPPAPADWAQ